MPPRPCTSSKGVVASSANHSLSPILIVSCPAIAASLPQRVVPLLLFFSRNLAVLHRGRDILVAEVLLQQPQAVPGIIPLDRVNGKGIAQLMRTDIVLLAGFGIYQLGQSG